MSAQAALGRLLADLVGDALALVVLASAMAYGDARLRVTFDAALTVLCGIALDAALPHVRPRRATALGVASGSNRTSRHPV